MLGELHYFGRQLLLPSFVAGLPCDIWSALFFWSGLTFLPLAINLGP